MKVRVTVMDEKSVASVDLTQDDAFTLIRALEQAAWYSTVPGSTRLPKGIEIAPV